MSAETCPSCRRPKAAIACELCGELTCKDCVQTLDENAFSFRPDVPAELKHLRYCQPCFDSTVAPERERYDETMERAKQVFFFYDTQKARLPVLDRARTAIQVVDQADRDETILRIAFIAASEGYNAVVDANVVCEKVRNFGYQKMRWKGKGVAANVDAVRLERDYE